MSKSKIVETIFTGQEIVAISQRDEWVMCARCNAGDTVGVRSSGYWDSELKKYVHKACLPIEQIRARNIVREDNLLS